MPHPVEAAIRTLRTTVRRLWLVHALCRALAVALAAAAVLTMADNALRFQDPGLRFIATGLWLGATAWAVWRYVWPAIRLPLDDIDLARRIERRHSSLAERLASAVEFLKQSEDDPLAGSAELRRRTIAEVSADLERVDLRQVVDRRAAWRAALVAAAIVVACALLAALDMRSTRIAVVRLASPWADMPWPRKNELKFVKPVRRLALGQRFEAEVIDVRGRDLPDRVSIHYRYDDEREPEQVEPMQLVAGSMLARRENVTRPFWYRATGGDDRSMAWTHVDVVEPPAVESLIVSATSPDYTALGESIVTPHLSVLSGTRIRIEGRSNKPLRSAAVQVEDGPRVPARVAEDGRSFVIPSDDAASFVVDNSGAYWFELEDHEGFVGGQEVRYEIRAIPDRPPTVAIRSPVGNLFFTAQAVVPLAVLAQDDLRIERVELASTRLDRTGDGESRTIIFAGPARLEPPASGGKPATMQAAGTTGDEREIKHAWDLAPLDLAPGSQLAWHVAATDYKPQSGQSDVRRITIITAAEFQDRLAERQEFILGELARLTRLERNARTQVGGVEIQLDEIGSLTKEDLDHLQSAELTQRQVERGLTETQDSVASQIRRLFEDMHSNRLDSSDVEQRLGQVLSEVERLGRESLPTITTELTAALKGFQSAAESEAQPGAQPPEAQSRAARALASAGQRQDQVIESLERLVDEFAQWDRYGRFHRDLAQLERDQQELAQETAELGRSTLSRSMADLGEQQKAELSKAGQRQAELAARFDRVQQRMQQMADEMGESDPAVSETLSDALAEARRQAVGGRMREASRAVGQNQIGQAAAEQNAAREALGELVGILSNRRESELARLVKKLREAESELAQLLDEQRGLRKKMDDLAADSSKSEAERKRELERLAREERKLQEEVERLARGLRRLQADQASRTASRGAARMSSSGDSSEQGDAAAAASQAGEAEKDLDEALEQLAEWRRQAEIDLAEEQLARLEDTVGGLRAQQEKLLAETRQYESLREGDGWSRAQSLSVQNLGRQQQSVTDETHALGDSLSGAAVFQLALEGAAREMARAAAMLGRLNTGGGTQRAEQQALRRLERLVAALAPDKNEPEEQQEGEQNKGGEGQPQSGNTRSLSELKLLKLLQEEVQLRTAELDDMIQKREASTADVEQEFAALAEEQGRLADLLLDLVAPPSDARGDEGVDLPTLEELDLQLEDKQEGDPAHDLFELKEAMP